MRAFRTMMAAVAAIAFLGGGLAIGPTSALASGSSTACEADGGTAHLNFRMRAADEAGAT